MQTGVLKALKQSLLAKLSHTVLGKLEEDCGAQHAETLTRLIKHSADIKDVRGLISSLPPALQRADRLET